MRFDVKDYDEIDIREYHSIIWINGISNFEYAITSFGGVCEKIKVEDVKNGTVKELVSKICKHCLVSGKNLGIRKVAVYFIVPRNLPCSLNLPNQVLIDIFKSEFAKCESISITDKVDWCIYNNSAEDQYGDADEFYIDFIRGYDYYPLLPDKYIISDLRAELERFRSQFGQDNGNNEEEPQNASNTTENQSQNRTLENLDLESGFVGEEQFCIKIQELMDKKSSEAIDSKQFRIAKGSTREKAKNRWRADVRYQLKEDTGMSSSAISRLVQGKGLSKNRSALYYFCILMHLTDEEANELFSSGGISYSPRNEGESLCRYYMKQQMYNLTLIDNECYAIGEEKTLLEYLGIVDNSEEFLEK